MTQDRIGTVLMVAAAGWMISLAFTEPGSGASTDFRVQIGITVAMMLIVAFFPRHLFLTGTVLTFSALGLALHIGLLGVFGIGVRGLLSAVVFAIAMWFIRDRLDGSALVVITALAACGLGMATPAVLIFALFFVAAVSAIIWIFNRISLWRSRATG